jgi:hypothetical protein
MLVCSAVGKPILGIFFRKYNFGERGCPIYFMINITRTPIFIRSYRNPPLISSTYNLNNFDIYCNVINSQAICPHANDKYIVSRIAL